ncbi:hypothetical protein O1L44_04445 [Streptomyces noursei]|nr:hypothetical protein [Streptomyces noursei]
MRPVRCSPTSSGRAGAPRHRHRRRTGLPGSALDPDRIAEHYLRLARQSTGAWEHDVLIEGGAVE